MKLTYAQAKARLGEIAAQATSIIDAAEANTEHPGQFTDEQRERFDALMAERDTIRSEHGIGDSDDACARSRGTRTRPQLARGPEGRRADGMAPALRGRQRSAAGHDWLDARANPAILDGMPDGGFDGLGDFLSAIGDTARGRYDERLADLDVRSQQTAFDGPGGGYLVPQRFQAELLMTAADEAPFLALRDIEVITGAGSGLVRPVVSDRDRSSEEIGGFALSRTSEGDTIAGDTVSFASEQLVLSKAAGLVRVNNELMTDSAVGVDRALRRVFGRAVMQRQALDFFAGTGTAGEPLGFLNSGALLTATRATSNKVDLSDVAAITSKLLPGAFGRAVWLAHPSVAEQVVQLSDSASRNVFVGQNAGDAPPSSLLGRPLFYTSAAKALGTQGDLSLVDPTAYLYIHRPLAIDVSRDADFSSDQTTFRIVLRDAGHPHYGASVTDEQSQSLSEFVTLAA